MTARHWTQTDLKELYLLSLPARLLLAGLAAAGILAAAYFFLFSGQLEQLARQQAAEKTLKNEFVRKSQTAARLPQLQTELQTLRTEMEQPARRMPSENDVPALIRELYQAAETFGLQVESIRPQTPESSGGLSKRPFQMVLIGTFPDTNRFLHRIGKLSYFTALESVGIHAGDSAGRLKTSVVIVTYTAK
ncbi:type 4a pilus biogenesis protein PilO [Neisseria lisongii]|uniref:Type 4a pilus biogenesis protein PilO n=1 Tax=Neisseria lisongii TaxID=2912188 RepID=A0AAW5AMN5_9NEIS|nr:type 4a pilus biogenesis protein PilO [Neisseria lisongii]MCF7530494.1 type 4a pilus biogenesis protein PilO [Neisseria lisongii]